MSRFFIKQISVTGEKVLFSEVSFNDGVNIIYGPSNAGKSYIINCINFMFAGDPPFTKSSTGYDTVTMTMESDDGYAIFMTRKIIDGKNGEVGENSVEVISNYPNVESGPYSISKNEYSDLLLKLMGINEHTLLRKAHCPHTINKERLLLLIRSYPLSYISPQMQCGTACSHQVLQSRIYLLSIAPATVIARMVFLPIYLWCDKDSQ